jgi:small subunit ribosomal protein S2
MVRMTKNFSGIMELTELPSVLFIVDCDHEEIAVAEAKRLGIAAVGLVDTNSDPTQLSHPIPGNDDAVKSIRIIVGPSSPRCSPVSPSAIAAATAAPPT